MAGSRIKSNLRDILALLLVATIIISAASVALITLLSPKKDKPVNSTSSSTPSDTEPPKPVEKIPFDDFMSIAVEPGVDYLTDEGLTFDNAVERSKALIDSAKADGFDAVELSLNCKDGLIFESGLYSAPFGNLLKEFYLYAKTKNLTVLTVLDVKALAKNDITDETDLGNICSVLENENIGKYSDGLILRNCFTGTKDSELSKDSAKYLNDAVNKFYLAAVKSDATLYTGVELNQSTMPDNIVQSVKQWLNDGVCDFVTVMNSYSTTDGEVKFADYFETVRKELNSTEVYCRLDYSKVGGDEKGWQATDQILKQLQALNSLESSSFVIDGYREFSNDTTESKKAVKKYLAHLLTEDYVIRELSVSSPSKKTYTTSSDTVLLSGASDPEFELTLNGEVLERSELGYFSLDLKLNDGLNTFNITHKGITETYKITYKRVIIKSVSPAKQQSFASSSMILISCVALKNSAVTALLAETGIDMTEEPIVDGNGFHDPDYSKYTGSIMLPTVYDQDIALGKITFTAKSPYGTESKQSGNINIIKEERPAPPPPSSSEEASSSQVSNSSSESSGEASGGTDSSNTTTSGENSSNSTSSSAGAPSGGAAWVRPATGDYDKNIGNTGFIAEIISDTAQTFNNVDKYDYSRPTNAYLPKGTVDYASKTTVTDGSAIMQPLRYGKSVYKKYDSLPTNKTDIKTYYGTLPDHQSINVAGFTTGNRHSELTLDVLWKAPFKLELNNQKYVNATGGNDRDYTLSGGSTFNYVDITFCYTTLVAGEVVVPEDNLIFSKAEWIKNEGDYTLRLHLKRTGVFYGWSAAYNTQGQLVFSFLNPARITTAENSYGHRLDGVVILLDVGHGGSDPGATGSNSKYTEAVLNLTLAKMVRAELEALGATVHMTRETDVDVGAYERKAMVRALKPDYVLAIHRNASSSSAPRGFASYYYNAFSHNAAVTLFDATANANLYQPSKWSRPQAHKFFYTCRTTECPTVLTENGFMSNASEYSDMIKDDFNQKCAVALAQGIVDYFKSIQ